MHYRRRNLVIVTIGWLIGPAALWVARPVGAAPPASGPLQALRADRDAANKMTWYTHPSSPRNRKAIGFFLFFGRRDDGSLTDLRLMVQYHGTVWLRMRQAQCTADGTVYDMPPVEKFMGWKNDSHGGMYWEWADVNLKTPEQKAIIRKIANAKQVSLRFDGKHEYHEETLTSRQLAALRDVIAAYEAQAKAAWR